MKKINQFGNSLLILVALISILGLVIGYLFITKSKEQINNDQVSSGSPIPLTTTNPTPLTETDLSLSIGCTKCDEFLTFLVTDPDGNQTGYVPSTKEYVLNIPGTSFGIEEGIGSADNSGPALPNSILFGSGLGGKELKKGIYIIQVNGFANGKYVLEIFVTGPGAPDDWVKIIGTASLNSLDTYKIDLPSGTYSKVSQ